MRFRAGTTFYRLRIAEGQLHVDGLPVQAATTDADREILLSATTEATRRRHVAARELVRAWEYETGTPATPDDWRELAATAAEAFLDGLMMQGGEQALIGLMPGESPEPGAARAGVGTNRECAECRGTIAGGSVVWTPGPVVGQATLKAWCEFCDRTMVWREMMTAKGHPAAITVGQPRYEPGDTSGARLAEV